MSGEGTDPARRLAKHLHAVARAHATSTLKQRLRIGQVVATSPLTIQPIGASLQLNAVQLRWSNTALSTRDDWVDGDSVLMAMLDDNSFVVIDVLNTGTLLGGGGGSIVSALNDLTDVTTTGEATNQVLAKTSGDWEPVWLTDANFSTSNVDGLTSVPSLRTLGSGAQQASPGNHTHNFSGITGTISSTQHGDLSAAVGTMHAYSQLTGTPTALPPSGAAGGDLAGTYPNPTVKASVGLSGSPTATTAAITTNNTQIATTAAVTTALGAYLTTAIAAATYLPLTGGSLSGALTVQASLPTITSKGTGTGHGRMVIDNSSSGSFAIINMLNNGTGVYDIVGSHTTFVLSDTVNALNWLTYTASTKTVDLSAATSVLAPTSAISTNNTNIATTAAVTAALGAYAVDANVVHIAGTETITGMKTFSSNVLNQISSAGSTTFTVQDTFSQATLIVQSANSGQATATVVGGATGNGVLILSAHNYVGDVSQTVTASKFTISDVNTGTNLLDYTFSSKQLNLSGNTNVLAPTVAVTTNNTNVATTAAVTTALASYALDASVVHTTGNESIAGTKTFTDQNMAITNATAAQLALNGGICNLYMSASTGSSTLRLGSASGHNSLLAFFQGISQVATLSSDNLTLSLFDTAAGQAVLNYTYSSKQLDLTGNTTVIAPTKAISTNNTNVATTAAVTSALASYATLASPALTGTPIAPTATAGTNTTQIATTAFVQTAALAASGLVGNISFWPGIAIPALYLECLGQSVSRTTYSALFAVLCPGLGTVTVTLASPGVFTLASHGLKIGDPVFLQTTGALPTGLVASHGYFVMTVPTSSTFTLGSSRTVTATTGAVSVTSAINTSVSQSGVHSLNRVPYSGISSTNFTLPDFQQRIPMGTLSGGAFPLGATWGEQAHTLTTAELPASGLSFSGTSASESANHTHVEYSELWRNTGATTFITLAGGGSNYMGTVSVGGSVSLSTGIESAAHTHGYSGTTSNMGSGGSHNNVQNVAQGAWIIYAGV